jgi:hypothetical protein
LARFPLLGRKPVLRLEQISQENATTSLLVAFPLGKKSKLFEDILLLIFIPPH